MSQYHHDYDGQNDDLLPAGRGLSGLRGPVPQPQNPLQPSAAELRRGAYYHNFKALNDLTDAGGYGRLFGIREDQSPISGHEYWALRRLDSGATHTVVMQFPDDFNQAQPCLVAAPSSGSRHVFGAVGTSGAWALLKKCAVVYTDKGTGTAVRINGDQRVYDINGQYLDVATHTNPFSQRQDPIKDLTVAMQHAHSGDNPEAFWGLFVLDSIRFAQDVMAQWHGVTDMTVIAASLSNGGGAVIRAAEQDTDQLIDAVVAAEPQIYLGQQNQPAVLQFKDQPTQPLSGDSLLAYALQSALYEPCAVLSSDLASSPFSANLVPMRVWLEKRCEWLREHQMLSGETTAELAAEARDRLLSTGMTESALQLSALNTFANLSAAITTTYANSYAAAAPADVLCGVAFSHFGTDGQAAVMPDQLLYNMFSSSSGIAPTPGIELAVVGADGGVQRLLLQSGYGFEAMHCFYQLWQQDGEKSRALKAGLKATAAAPKNNRKPTIIVHGRSDATVHINHASRAYYARHRQAHGRSQLRYYEITHVQHFDAFLSYPGMNQRFVPMHSYFEQALDLMWSHLTDGSVLPASQVVLTKPRGLHNGTVPPLVIDHVPPIQMEPAVPLQFIDNTLVIPE